MIIHYIVHFSLSDNVGQSIGTLQKIKNLIKLGNDLIVFSPVRNQTDNFQTIYVTTPKGKYISKICFQLALACRLILHYFKTERRPDVIISRHHILNFGFLIAALLFKIPYVLDIHADVIEEVKLDPRSRLIPKFYFNLYSKYEKFLFQKAAGILVNQPILKRFFSKTYNIKPEKFCAVPNGSDVDFFKPSDKRKNRELLGKDMDTKRLTFVGNVSEYHGVDYIIQAIPHLLKLRSDFIVDVVGSGSGSELKNLVQLAKTLNVYKYVNFVGRVPRDDVAKWVSASDICLLPAKMLRKHPGSPIKLFDYIALGRPVLAANVEGYGDFVEENKLGMKVDYTNPKEVAEKIDGMLDSHLSIYEKHNRYLAETKFSWLQRAKQIQQFLKEVLELNEKFGV